MIIVRAKGRLGNQLFFLAAASRAREKKNEAILGFGFEDVSPHFRPRYGALSRVRFFGKATWRKLRLTELAAYGQRLGLIGTIGVSRSSEYYRTKSVLGIWVMAPGYYQRYSLVDVSIVRKLRDAFLEENKQKFAEILYEKDEDSKRSSCFVHVRRGDYANFPTKEFPALLPSSWFFRKIFEVKEKTPDTVFLLFSDDQPFCEANFSGVEGLVFVHLEPFESFVAMSLCDQGILSPSSLSWWAARLAVECSQGAFHAPQFWFWWPQNLWRDDTLQDSSFLEWDHVTKQSTER